MNMEIKWIEMPCILYMKKYDKRGSLHLINRAKNLDILSKKLQQILILRGRLEKIANKRGIKIGEKIVELEKKIDILQNSYRALQQVVKRMTNNQLCLPCQDIIDRGDKGCSELISQNCPGFGLFRCISYFNNESFIKE